MDLLTIKVHNLKVGGHNISIGEKKKRKSVKADISWTQAPRHFTFCLHHLSLSSCKQVLGGAR